MVSSFYFAHPVTMYDTPAERRIAEAFKRRFPGCEVENPNQPRHSEGYKTKGMGYFVDLCNQQDGVFFTTFANGSVGAGVAKEVESFLAREAPVYYFDPKTRDFVPIKDLGGFQVLSVDDSRSRLREERRLAEAGLSPYLDVVA